MNRLLTKIADAWLVLTHPLSWSQIDATYSRIHDDLLKSFLATGGTFEDHTGFTATAMGIPYWVSNHPYASFRMVMLTHDGEFVAFLSKFRPSRATIIRAGRKLKKDILNQSK